jgi:hypothetical protein
MKVSGKLFSTSTLVAPMAAGFILLAATGGALAHGGGGGNHGGFGGGNGPSMNNMHGAMQSGGNGKMTQDHGNRKSSNRKSDNRTTDASHKSNSSTKTMEGKTTEAKTTDAKKSATAPVIASASTPTTQTAATNAKPAGTSPAPTTSVAPNPSLSVAMAGAPAAMPGTGFNNTIHPIIAPAPAPGTGGTNTIHPIIATPTNPPALTNDTGQALKTFGLDIVKGASVPFALAGAVGVEAPIVGVYGLFHGGIGEAAHNAKTVVTNTWDTIKGLF